LFDPIEDGSSAHPPFLAPTGVAVPRLRSFAEDLTAELLDEMPVTRIVGEQSPLLEPLRQAGITTVGLVRLGTEGFTEDPQTDPHAGTDETARGQ
jgi:hypothetical protein